MLIAMAGLPGTGKSTLARALEQSLDAVLLDKDRVRAVLFPTRVLDYSPAQDDTTMAAIYQAARLILTAPGAPAVILDGRTFLRTGQLDPVQTLATDLAVPLRIIECVCSEEEVRERLERDLAEGAHPARNRTFAMYRCIKAQALPLPLPHLTLDTGRLSLAECVERSVAYLRKEAS